jgi:hypothetical protein
VAPCIRRTINLYHGSLPKSVGNFADNCVLCVRRSAENAAEECLLWLFCTALIRTAYV